MDEETLNILLKGGHLSMRERIERGQWPHPPLSFKDLVKHLAKMIQNEKWFPNKREPYSEGKPIDERGSIERISKFIYIYHSQRAQATNPTVLAEKEDKVFLTPTGAAKFYLKWDLCLPGDLDGWIVTK